MNTLAVILDNGTAVVRTSDNKVKGPFKTVLHALVWLDTHDAAAPDTRIVVRENEKVSA